MNSRIAAPNSPWLSRCRASLASQTDPHPFTSCYSMFLTRISPSVVPVSPVFSGLSTFPSSVQYLRWICAKLNQRFRFAVDGSSAKYENLDSSSTSGAQKNILHKNTDLKSVRNINVSKCVPYNVSNNSFQLKSSWREKSLRSTPSSVEIWSHSK